MKEKIKEVLDRHKDSQGNMASDSFRDMLATEIEAVLLSQGLPLHSNHLAEGPDDNGMYPWHKNNGEGIGNE